jgi:hypothetical protein
MFEALHGIEYDAPAFRGNDFAATIRLRHRFPVRDMTGGAQAIPEGQQRCRNIFGQL